MSLKKYVKVQNGIISLIASRNIGVGEALPTEPELAEMFGVSIITVRRAVSHLENINLVRRIQGKGTFVTSKIPGAVDNGRIVFLEVAKTSLSTPVLEHSLDLMDGELHRRGYQLQMLRVGGAPTSSVIKVLNDARGVVASGWINTDWLRILNALSIPAVFLGSVLEGKLDIPAVDFDWKEMARLLTATLLERGAQKPLLIVGGADYPPTIQMVAGYKQALEQAGSKFSPDLIYYSEGDVPKTLRNFLEDNGKADGLVIERGCYVHVLNTLFNSDHRPRMAVMSVGGVKSAGECENMIEATFEEDIYARSVLRLFEIIESNQDKFDDLKIQPILQE